VLWLGYTNTSYICGQNARGPTMFGQRTLDKIQQLYILFELLFELVGPYENHIDGQNAGGPTMFGQRTLDKIRQLYILFELLFELVGPDENHIGGQNAKGPTMLRPRPWTNGHSTLKYPPQVHCVMARLYKY